MVLVLLRNCRKHYERLQQSSSRAPFPPSVGVLLLLALVLIRIHTRQFVTNHLCLALNLKYILDQPASLGLLRQLGLLRCPRLCILATVFRLIAHQLLEQSELLWDGFYLINEQE